MGGFLMGEFPELHQSVIFLFTLLPGFADVPSENIVTLLFLAASTGKESQQSGRGFLTDLRKNVVLSVPAGRA
jgi:hypothetical protein